MNMTFKNRSRKITRLSFLLFYFFPPKSWLAVNQNHCSRCFLQLKFTYPTEKSIHLQSRAMNYFPYLTVCSSLRSNQNLLLFTLNLKLVSTSVFAVHTLSDASFLHKDPSTCSKIEYNFQNPFDLEETQPCIQNIL